MVFESLTALVRPIAIAHPNRPDPPRDTPHNRVFRIHAIGEEKREIWCKLINTHSPGKISLNIGKPIGQCQCELGNRVRTSFRDVITRYRYRVKIANTVIDKILLYVSHHPQAEIG